MPIRVECCPAFNYARDEHHTVIVNDDSIPEASLSSPTTFAPLTPGSDGEGNLRIAPPKKALFTSRNLSLDLRFVCEGLEDDGIAPVKEPRVDLRLLDLSNKGHLGKGVYCDMDLVEGQTVTFVLRAPPSNSPPGSSRPTVEQANQLGVPMQSGFYLSVVLNQLSDIL